MSCQASAVLVKLLIFNDLTRARSEELNASAFWYMLSVATESTAGTSVLLENVVTLLVTCKQQAFHSLQKSCIDVLANFSFKGHQPLRSSCSW